MKKIEMLGKKFGRLTVISRVANNKEGKPVYFCKCSCGRTSSVYGKLLRSGKTQSCGCLRYERLRASITKHGYSFTKTYKTWSAMRERCNNKNDFAYKHYGGRGISVCERWRDFQNFLADMGHRPKGKTLDRINVNGNYEPDNCRWATPLEQANNQRKTIILSFNGVTQSLGDWSRQLNIPHDALWMRLQRGKSTQEVLSTPKHIPERVKFRGELMTYPEIAKAVGMSYITLRWRIRKGMPLEKAAQLPDHIHSKPELM